MKALTVNVAYQLNEENRLGKLKVGYVANMSVFDADFLKDDMAKIYRASTIATIVDGQVVYGQK
ncbi:MAG: amidohydrolase family protein [Bacteroidales bacterium]|nr:amidohydrolase family protein [Bacteroidales bacterium]